MGVERRSNRSYITALPTTTTSSNINHHHHHHTTTTPPPPPLLLLLLFRRSLQVRLGEPNISQSTFGNCWCEISYKPDALPSQSHPANSVKALSPEYRPLLTVDWQRSSTSLTSDVVVYVVLSAELCLAPKRFILWTFLSLSFAYVSEACAQNESKGRRRP